MKNLITASVMLLGLFTTGLSFAETTCIFKPISYNNWRWTCDNTVDTRALGLPNGTGQYTSRALAKFTEILVSNGFKLQEENPNVYNGIQGELVFVKSDKL